MKQYEIGKTGMKVSNLSFGASSLGGVFHNVREAEGIKAVHTAWARRRPWVAGTLLRTL